MHKLLIDINIILDVALEREPHHSASQQLLIHIEKKKAAGYLSAISYPTIYYIVQKGATHKKAIAYIENLLKLVSTVEVNQKILKRSLQIDLKDFEDSIQVACAEACQADYIITRNPEDYKNADFPFMLPAEYLASLKA